MGGSKQDGYHLEVSHEKRAENSILQKYNRKFTLVWFRKLDSHEDDGKRLDGNYTRLLRKVQDLTWKDRKTNEERYGHLDPISNIIRTRRLRFIGHAWRRPEETIHQLLLWEPKHGKRSRGRPRATFMEQLYRDTNLRKEELTTAMQDREKWRKIVKVVRVLSHLAATDTYNRNH